MNCQTKIILASASPQRIQILRNAGFNPAVHPSSYQEIDDPALSPAEQALEHAINKCLDVAQNYTEGIVIGCDTIVDLNGLLVGKPVDQEHAYQIIKAQQGKIIQVRSGLCLLNTANGQQLDSIETTQITFEPMTEAEIAWYIESGEWQDKSGAFSIQGLGARFISNIQGDFLNVVGLPLRKVYEFIKILEGN